MGARARWAVAGLVLLVGVVASLGLGGWLLAEEAGVAPPPEAAARSVARRVERAWPSPPSSDDRDRPGDLADSGAPARAGCPGPVEATLPGGAPFEGRVRMGGAWAPLEDGRAWLDDRPCGRALVRVQAAGGAGVRGLSTSARVTVQGDTAVVVVVGAPGEAEVETVDASGARVDAVVARAQPIAPGLFRVEGLGAVRSVVVGPRGAFGRRVEVPLDGARHSVEVVPDRVVAVTLRCDHCPERVTCELSGQVAAATCSGVAPDLRCRCPPAAATLMARWPDALLDHTDHVQPLAGIDADEVEVLIDVRGQPGMVEGRWGGPADALASIARPGSAGRHVPLDDDGSFTLVDLLPGDWELTLRAIGAGRSDAQVVAFHLRSGETLDLGTRSADADAPP